MPHYIETIEEDLNRIWGPALERWYVGGSGAGPNAYWFWYAGIQNTLHHPKGTWRCSGEAPTLKQALLDMRDAGLALDDALEDVDHPTYAKIKKLERHDL